MDTGCHQLFKMYQNKNEMSVKTFGANDHNKSL